MNTKRMIGIGVLIIGVILIIFSLYEKQRIAGANSEIQTGVGLFSGNPTGNAVGGGVGDVLEGEVSQYDTPVLLCFIGGIVLVVIGGGVAYYGKKKKR